MHPSTGGQSTDLERAALEAGLARIYRGRLIPIIRGGDETDEEKATREAEEAAAKKAAEEAAAASKTFSQADVDRIVQERVARAKATPPADYDELKQKAAEFDKLDEANKTELEKAQKAAADAQAAP